MLITLFDRFFTFLLFVSKNKSFGRQSKNKINSNKKKIVLTKNKSNINKRRLTRVLLSKDT
jgi:hypothetical protein